MSADTKLEVLCDDCKPTAFTMNGPFRGVEFALGDGKAVEDVYRCVVNNCGRMYSKSMGSGYFNDGASGRGYRLRNVPCHSAHQRPMYIKSIRHDATLNQDFGVFKCPECQLERDEPIPTIPARSIVQ